MAKIFNDCIESLRKKSKILLTQVDENSKQIVKLHSQNLNEHGSCDQKKIKSWKLRNDSGEISAILCPNYFPTTLNYRATSMVNIPASRKIVITSKKRCKEQCLQNAQRKPVKGCYCNSKISNVTKRSYEQNVPLKTCKSCNDTKSVDVKEIAENQGATPLISCETLQRLQKIDYTPKSQFLRNVQSKAVILQGVSKENYSTTHPRSPCKHRCISKECRKNINYTYPLKSTSKEPQYVEIEKSTISSEVTSSLECSGGNISSKDDMKNVNQRSSHKETRPWCGTRNTLSFKKFIPQPKKNVPNLKIKSKKANQFLHNDCPCCYKSKWEKLSETTGRTEKKKYNTSPENYKAAPCVNHHKQFENTSEYSCDKDIRDIKTFRDQNYFDTHGSHDILSSAKSSSSLEHYLLNERLFPEPLRRVHKKDLVVTMPPCATMQRKRIHYFPRYIIRQEKCASNVNYKKKLCHHCPLTGHAIDLGIVKVRPAINSLALKYQKKLS